MQYRRLFASCNVLLPTFLLKYSSLGLFPTFPLSPHRCLGSLFSRERMCLGSMFTECNLGKEYTISFRIWLKETHLFLSVLFTSISKTINCSRTATL